jgi:hypothetical protein
MYFDGSSMIILNGKRLAPAPFCRLTNKSERRRRDCSRQSV